MMEDTLFLTVLRAFLRKVAKDKMIINVEFDGYVTSVEITAKKKEV